MLRLATLKCPHCGEELCFDTWPNIFNEKMYRVIKEIKTKRCPVCFAKIDFTKANLTIHKPPLEV